MAKPSTTLHEHERLSGSRIADVDFSESQFDDVNLQRATFENVSLVGARFHNVDFSHASIDDANLNGLKINGVAVTELFRAYEARNGVV